MANATAVVIIKLKLNNNMATKKQIDAAKKNIKKAQAVWKTMTRRQRALAQPEGRKRQKPGSTGKGEYFSN